MYGRQIYGRTVYGRAEAAVSADLDITLGLHSNANVIHSAAVALQASQVITVGLHSNTNVIPTHEAVAQAAQAVTVGLHSNVNVIQTLTVVIGVEQDITVGLITNVNVIQLAAVALQASQVITAGLLVNPNVIHIPAVTGPIPLDIGLPLIVNVNRIYTLKVDGVSLAASQEIIPYAPNVPDSILELDPQLHDFLEDQTRTLREQHVKMIHGQTTMDFSSLFALYDGLQFDLGTQGRFNHPLYGLIIARFVQFSVMHATQEGGPVGFSPNTSLLDWSVTNDFEQSAAFNAVGVIATGESITEGRYGWVIVQGANIQPLPLKSGETAEQGNEIAWSGTLEVTTQDDGVTLGFYVAAPDVPSATGFAAGDLVIQLSSNTGRQAIRTQGLRIDLVDARIDDVEAEIAVVQQASVDGDVALATQINSVATTAGDNTALINSEQAARTAGDSAIAQDVTDLVAVVGVSVAALQTEIKTVEVNLTAAMAADITQLRAELQSGIDLNQSSVASFSGQISTLATEQVAQAVSIGTVQAGVESPAGNMLGLDAGPEQSADYLFLDKELTANLALEGADFVSFSGAIDAEGTAVDLRLRLTFWTVADAHLGNFDTELQSGSGYVDVFRDGIQLPATTAKISLLLVRASGTGGLSKRVNFTRGPAHRAFSDSVNAAVTTSIEARVAVNEGDIVTAFARWAVTLDVNDNISGLELVSGLDTQSTFKVLVDNFQVADASTSETVFEIDGGVVKLKEVVVSQLIRSDNWDSGGNSEGFSLDRTTGVFQGQGIAIKDSAGVTIFGVGGAVMASITDAGLFATAPQLTSSNISTYIANVAIQTAQIGLLQVTTGVIANLAVDTLQIAGSAVETDKVLADAITKLSLTTNGSAINSASTTWVNAITTAFTKDEAASEIALRIDAQPSGTVNSDLMEIRVVRDSTTLFNLFVSLLLFGYPFIARAFLDTSGAGSYSYKVDIRRWIGTGTVTLATDRCSLHIQEFKR